MTRSIIHSPDYSSLCNAAKYAYFSIIKSRIRIRISSDRAWHHLQEAKDIFKKIVVKNFTLNFQEII